MIVSEKRWRTWAASRQRKVSGARTRLRGTLAAESAALGRSGSPAAYPRTSGPKVTDPLTARV